MTPAVFIVSNTYQIMLPVEYEATMWVKVGDKNYYDQSNGILRSRNYVHRVSVPKEELDSQKCYTVYLRRITDRKPYFTETAEVEEVTYEFHPVQGDAVRAYHISDAHGSMEEPVQAAKLYGNIDFLILNGDILDFYDEEKSIIVIYKIISEITHGTIPVVFSRGNHDMRGKYAEKLAEYTPCENGNSYYTFRLGSIWGMVMDCGEDKPDERVEYGHTICCHEFRKEQTEFFRQVIENADKEYESEGITHKLILVHKPFTKQREEGIFRIEEELFESWTKMLREHIKPDVMLCGHLHEFDIFECGSEADSYGQPCPVVIGSEIRWPDEETVYFGGTGLQFEKNKVKVTYTSSTGENEERVCIDFTCQM